MSPLSASAAEVYAELLERVGEAHPRPRIEPVRRLAELAGSPQLSYPVIHVAGTNGKTSTSRGIDSLIRAHGLRTGLFTSPHLVSFTERFQIDGEPVSDEALTSAWAELQLPLSVVDAELRAADQGPITFFEALAVLGFSIFADAPVDVAIIEVGMGGEWDATNIVQAQVAVFTPIDLDHTAHLGHDFATIARTKAGIMKPGATVVSAVQHEDALSELQAAAETLDLALNVADRNFGVEDDLLAVGGRQVALTGLTGHRYPPVFLPLYGSHQAQNATLAVAAVEAFFGGERPIPDEILEEGFGQLTSPGRLQLIGTDPVVYVDAAHNPHGAEALARAVTESFQFSELAVVAGVLAEKDAHGVLAALAPIADQLYLAPVDSVRGSDPAELLETAADVFEGTAVEVTESLPEALDIARAWAARGESRGVLVTGSIVLVGEAIAFAREEGWGIA